MTEEEIKTDPIPVVVEVGSWITIDSKLYEVYCIYDDGTVWSNPVDGKDKEKN